MEPKRTSVPANAHHTEGGGGGRPGHLAGATRWGGGSAPELLEFKWRSLGRLDTELLQLLLPAR
jgi:hypothetical protein